MTLQELENQILALSSADKIAILLTLTRNISGLSQGITKTPGVCGGEACVAGTRIPVWLIVEARQLEISEAQILQDYPHLNAIDLVNAWAYAKAFPDEVDTAIHINAMA